jgi:hypothetical protein
MTTMDTLRTRKMQLEQDLTHGVSEEQREQIEGELIKIDIALSFLDETPRTPARQDVRKPPLG